MENFKVLSQESYCLLLKAIYIEMQCCTLFIEIWNQGLYVFCFNEGIHILCELYQLTALLMSFCAKHIIDFSLKPNKLALNLTS